MNQVNRKSRNDVLFIAVLLLIVVLAGASVRARGAIRKISS